MREEFLGFSSCHSGTKGRDLTDLFPRQLNDWGLSLEGLRGQGYDGAGNMSGCLNGCAAAIKEQQLNALYFCCASHLLNLTVVTMSNIPFIRNMWDTMTQLCLFLRGSDKHYGALKTTIKELGGLIDSTRQKLVDLCPTR